MSGRHDPDLVLGDAGDGRVERPVRVRRLGGGVHGEPARHAVHARDRAARLQRRRVHARVEQVAGAHVLGGGEDGVGGGGVARLPVEDPVVGAPVQLVAHQRGVRVERPPGVDERGQRLVLDVDQRQRVPGGVAVLGDDERHLLTLVADLVGGEDRGHVVRERGHPGEASLGEHVPGDHRTHLRVRLGRARVHRQDPRVRVRAAQHRAVQHAGQRDVVDEAAAAPDEPGVLLAQHAPVTHRRAVLARSLVDERAHDACSRSAAAACRTERTMFS